ncbi:hypothetical protein ACFWJT_16000 [Streptomyces sp. NPDC127069]|uniref:hypothetical protein n=1 Tax=Streptomyces sp. NPDC127069 TaxID=3347128 RepID=UPI00365028B7
MSDRQLASLVQSRRAELGLSFAALTEAAVDPEMGDRLSHGWVHRLETGKPVTAPGLPQLRALACGLQLPLSRVQWAAASQFFGLEEAAVQGEEDVIVELLRRLHPAQRDALKGFLEACISST